MAACNGKSKIRVQCGSLQSRCKKCGNAGCDSNHSPVHCTKQAFYEGRCKKCGNSHKEDVVTS